MNLTKSNDSTYGPWPHSPEGKHESKNKRKKKNLEQAPIIGQVDVTNSISNALNKY